MGDWKVALPNGEGAGTAALSVFVDLFMADSTGVLPAGTAIASTRFRTIPPAATYFMTPVDHLIVPNTPPGTVGARFVAVISSVGYRPLTVPLTNLFPLTSDGGGDTLPPTELLPTNLAILGTTVFLSVPEPSTIALGAICGTILVLLRRRRD